MKAKDLSLLAKGIAIAIIITSWVMLTFFGKTINMTEVLMAAGGIAAVFSDVSLNILAEKFRATKPDDKNV